MKLNFERMLVIDYSILEKLFFETYGYEVDILPLLFDDYFCNDSYQRFDLDIAEKESDNEDVLKVIKLLRDNGVSEDKVLMGIFW